MLVANAAVWGSSYMFIKVALDDFSEGAIVCLRTALGALLLLSFAASRGVLGDIRPRVRWMVVIAFVQVVVPFLLITYGENHISSSLTAILISSVPIYTALLAMRFDHAERSHGWALVGIVIGIVGVVMLFGLDLSGSADELDGRRDDARRRALLRDLVAAGQAQDGRCGARGRRRRDDVRGRRRHRAAARGLAARAGAGRSTRSRRSSRSAWAGPGSRSSSSTR